jgi:hypothetical protein
MRRLALLIALVVLAVTSGGADAAATKRCRPVAAGTWDATDLQVARITCRSVQAKLRRWFLRDATPLLPRSRWAAGIAWVVSSGRATGRSVPASSAFAPGRHSPISNAGRTSPFN